MPTSIPVAQERFIEICTTHLGRTRNLAKLAGKGIDSEYFLEYETELNTAKGYKTDEAILKELGIITADKDKKLSLCYDCVKDVYFFMEQKFKGKPEMNELPANPGELKSNESRMINEMPLIISTYERHKTELKAPADFSTTLTTALTNLAAANELQEAKKDANKIYTKERSAAFAKVYDRIKQVNKAGRLAYADDPITLSLFDNPFPKDGDNDEPDQPPTPPPSPS